MAAMRAALEHVVMGNEILRTTYVERAWRVFCTDVARGYEALRRGNPLPMIADPRLQYPDFAGWEREALRPDGLRYCEEVDWWRPAFEPGHPALRLPFSRPTPVPDAAPADGVIHWGIEAAEAAALDELALRFDPKLSFRRWLACPGGGRRGKSPKWDPL